MTDKKSRPSSDLSKVEGAPIDVDAPSITTPEDNFPKILADLREERGLKHDSLSELTKHVDPQKRGIARTTLRGYELGVTKPGIRELRILSLALGVSINRLVFGTDRQPTTLARGDALTNDPVAEKNTEDFVKAARFVVSIFNLGEQERDTVYRVATNLAAAKLGEVEYRKLMDTTQEFVETISDAHEDSIGGVENFLSGASKETTRIMLQAILEKYGYKLKGQDSK